MSDEHPHDDSEDSTEFTPEEWHSIFDEEVAPEFNATDSAVVRKIDEVSLNEHFWRKVMLNMSRENRRNIKDTRVTVQEHVDDCTAHRTAIEIRINSLDRTQKLMARVLWFVLTSAVGVFCTWLGSRLSG